MFAFFVSKLKIQNESLKQHHTELTALVMYCMSVETLFETSVLPGGCPGCCWGPSPAVGLAAAELAGP